MHSTARLVRSLGRVPAASARHPTMGYKWPRTWTEVGAAHRLGCCQRSCCRASWPLGLPGRPLMPPGFLPVLKLGVQSSNHATNNFPINSLIVKLANVCFGCYDQNTWLVDQILVSSISFSSPSASKLIHLRSVTHTHTEIQELKATQAASHHELQCHGRRVAAPDSSSTKYKGSQTGTVHLLRSPMRAPRTDESREPPLH